MQRLSSCSRISLFWNCQFSSCPFFRSLVCVSLALGIALLTADSASALRSDVPEAFSHVSLKSTTGSTTTLNDTRTVADANPPSSSLTNAASDSISSVSGLAQAIAPAAGSLTGTLKSLSYSSGTEFDLSGTNTEAIAKYRAAYDVLAPGGVGSPVPFNLDITLDGFLDVDSAPSGLQTDNPRTASAEIFLIVQVWPNYSDYLCSGFEGCPDTGEFVFRGNTKIRRSSRTSSNPGLLQSGDFMGTGSLASTVGNDRWDVAISDSIALGFAPLGGDTIIVQATLTSRASYLDYTGAAGAPALENTADFSNTFSFLPTSSDPDASFAFVAVPEPGTATLLVLGLVAMVVRRPRSA